VNPPIRNSSFSSPLLLFRLQPLELRQALRPLPFPRLGLDVDACPRPQPLRKSSLLTLDESFEEGEVLDSMLAERGETFGLLAVLSGGFGGVGLGAGEVLSTGEWQRERGKEKGSVVLVRFEEKEAAHLGQLVVVLLRVPFERLLPLLHNLQPVNRPLNPFIHLFPPSDFSFCPSPLLLPLRPQLPVIQSSQSFTLTR